MKPVLFLVLLHWDTCHATFKLSSVIVGAAGLPASEDLEAEIEELFRAGEI
jgi:hypothetical protein